MTPQERLAEIEELESSLWFVDNPNALDVNTEVRWLIARVKHLEKALDKIDNGRFNDESDGDIAHLALYTDPIDGNAEVEK